MAAKPAPDHTSTIPGPATTSGRRQPTAALVLLCLAQFMVLLDVSIVNVALPTIGTQLHLADVGIDWVVNAYAVVFGGFLLLGGRTGDLLGRRRTFLTGVALFTLASLGCGLAATGTELIALRAAAGFGAAVMAPAVLSLIAENFPEPHERARAIGIWGAISGLGSGAGMLLGGILTSTAGWPWVFYVNIPVGLLILAALPRVTTRSTPAAAPRTFDAPGALTVTGALLLLVYGLSQAPEHGWASPAVAGCLAAGAALLAAFVRIEAHAAQPLLPLPLLRIPSLRGAAICGGLLYTGAFAVWVQIAVYLQRLWHYSAVRTGLAILICNIAIVLAARLTQRYIPRTGPRPLLLTGIVCLALATAAYARLPLHGSYAVDLLAPLLLNGLGLGLTSVTVAAAGMSDVPADRSGTASGILNTTRQIGGAIGLALAGTVAAAGTSSYTHHHPTQTDAALLHGYHLSFALLAALAVAALLAAITLFRPTNRTSAAAR
ncbi:MFS transporter [Kitasatospora sp. NPDC004669]|uniref:MFS transporter n=1 Tax=Kitasatospora sp. NPDC004669 TaxID=3154555 RepID=UPI0033AAE961